MTTKNDTSNNLILNERELKAWNAISNFISALHDVFGASNKPLALYNRLIIKTSIRDVIPIRRHVAVFNNFLLKNKTQLLSEKTILDKDKTINYSDRVFIDLPAFLKKSNKQTLLIIKEHLLTIIAILHPEDEAPLEKLEVLENGLDEITKNVDTSTKEGAFIGNMMNTLKDSFSNGDLGEMDMSNPMSFITNMMSSGLPEQLLGSLSNLTQPSENGKSSLDPASLMNTMQGLVKTLTSSMDPESKKELKNMTSSLMSMFEESPQETKSQQPQHFVAETQTEIINQENHTKITDTHIVDIETHYNEEIPNETHYDNNPQVTELD